MAISQAPWPGPLSQEGGSARPDPQPSVVRLLVVNGDEVARTRLAAELRPFHHVVLAVDSPAAAISWLDHQSADVVLVYAETHESALEAAARIHSASARPLIVVGPDATAENRVGAFERGAQDYIPGPVTPDELDRRVRVLIRRDQFRRRSDDLTGPGGLLMQVRSHEVYIGTEKLSLTPKEFSVLQLLLEHRGEVVAPDQLSLSIWGYETFGSRNFVEAHISRLRGKLSRAGTAGIIKTVRGIGYVIR
jgi:DNA-binding response OmpR family regulator